MNDYSQIVQRYKELKQERNEAVAQVGVMRDALSKIRGMPRPVDGSVSIDRPIYRQWVKTNEIAESALSTTTPAALREIQARTLEEAADWFESAPIDYAFAVRNGLREMAAAKRKGG